MDTATEFTFVDQANNIPLTQDQLKLKLKHQLEFYFSMENLSNDTYMLSQMDHDHYIPISTIANFNKVKHLTTDLTLVVEVLKESPYVQVEQTGLKVRPVQKQRSILILREIPQATPIEDVEKLFRGENCPTLVSCEFGLNNSWYVFFESEQDAQQAYKYLREERATFQGKPIMARIKAKQVLQSASQLPPSASLQTTPPNSSNTPQPSPQQASPHLAKNLQVRVVPAVVKPTVPSDLPLSQPPFSNFSYITHLQPTAFIHNSANFPLWQQINSPLISLDPSMFRFTPLYDLNKKSHTDHALHNQSLQQQQLQQQPTTEQPQQHGQLIQQEQQQKQFHNFFQNQHKPQFHQPFYSSYPQQQHHHQQQPQQQKHQHPQQKQLQQQQHKNRQQQQQQQQRFNNKKTTIQDNNNNDIVNNTLNNTTNDKRSDELKVFKPLSPFQNSFQQQQHQQQQQLQQHQQQHLITFPQRLQLSNMQQHPQIFTLESPRTLTKTSADRKEYAQRHRKTDSHKHLLDNSSKQQINFSPSYTFPPPPHIASGFYNSPLKSAQFHFDNTSSAFNNNSNSYKNNNNPTNLNNINKNVNNIYINNINNANNINNNVYNKNNVNTLSKQAYFRDASFSSYSKNQSFNNNNNNNSSSNNNNNKLTSESYSSALPVSSSTPPSSSSSSSSSSSFPPSSSSLPKSVISSSTSSTSSTSTTTPSTSTTKTTTSSSSSSSSACTASQALFAPMPKQLQETACNSKSHQNNNINSPTFVSSNKIDISKNNTFQHKKNNDPNNDHNNPIPKKNISANNITSSHPHTRSSISCTPSTHPTNRTDHRPRSVQHKTFEAQQQDPDCSTKNNKNKNNKNIVNNNDNVKNTVTENGNDVNSVTNKSNNSNKIIRNTLNEHYKCNKKVNNNNKNNYNNKNVINNNKNNDDSNNNDTMKQPPKHNCESSAKAFHSAASPQPPHLSSSLSSSLLQPPPSSSAPPSSKDPVAKTRPSFKPSPDNSNQHSNKKSSVRPRKGSSYSRNGRQSNRAKLVREDSKQKKSVGRDKGAPVHEPFDKSFPPLFLNKNCPYHHESETKESHSASATLKNIAVKPLMDCNSRLSYAQIAQRSASVQIASDEDCTPPLQSMPIQSVAPPLVTAPLA